MGLILKDGSVFLHVPKTGGNWVVSVLRELKLVRAELSHKHADAPRLFFPTGKDPWEVARKYIKARYSRFVLDRSNRRGSQPFMFCFVRNPLAWYESWFKYMSQPHVNWKRYGATGNPRDWHPAAHLNGLGAPDFNQFVRNVIARRPGFVTEMYAGYTGPEVAFVGKQENLREDLAHVLRLRGLEFDEEYIRNCGPVGASVPRTVPAEWDPDLRACVTRLEYGALVRYGYDSMPVVGSRCIAPGQGMSHGVMDRRTGVVAASRAAGVRPR